MKKLLILGAGTAGTMTANKLYRLLDSLEWEITLVDQDARHYYQPGFLFIPFGTYTEKDVIKPKRTFIPDGVTLIMADITAIDPENNQVHLTDNLVLAYDFLVIATGTHPRPEETPGMAEEGWQKSIYDFYTLEGATALAQHLHDWEGGRLVLNIVDMPIKCPVAPLEFIFLADSYFRQKGMRDRVDLTLVTPLSGAFTKPKAAALLNGMLAEKQINVVPDFYLEQVEPASKRLISYDEEEVEYDLLVTVPLNMGADIVADAGLGDDLNHVKVDKHNFLSTQYDNIFALGDAANLPTSKAGSVAHFAVEIFTENFENYVAQKALPCAFDGHANCYVETGFGKGMLIDFNYDVEPLPGKYPLPGLGPFSLLQESRLNHWGKMSFRWIYWNMLLKGKPLPVPTNMSMAGKWQ